MGVELLKFKDDFSDFYIRLSDTQKAHFIEFADKHANFQLNDCINEIEELKVIV